MSRPSKRGRRDAYQAITDRIIDALEHGTVPWRMPWRSRGFRNALTNRPYRGINLLILAIAAIQGQWEDPRWLTYRQATTRGGHVRRGERGTPVIFWTWLERHVGTEDDVEHIPLLRVYTVFNVAQCDDLDLPPLERVATFDSRERAEAIFVGYRDAPALHHDAECAYYSPAEDAVHLPPPGAFRDADGYYATLFHELAHSTGHAKRLARPNFQAGVAPYGSENYSREELLAEFASAFLCSEASMPASRLEQSAAYIASWLRALRDDKRLAVIAASQAQRAADHILGHLVEHHQDDEEKEPDMEPKAA